MRCAGIERPAISAFLTMEDTAGWSIDAGLAIEPLEALGWTVEWVPWRRTGIDWDKYRAVYVGVPWDYPRDPEHFLEVLEAIDRSSAVLVNDLALVRWTLSKTYLRDLEARGVNIVPSFWFDDFRSAPTEGFFDLAASERIIVKPVVSTNATDTFLLERKNLDGPVWRRLETTFEDRPFVVQPFISRIQDEGEYSLFYIAGEFSHAIRKTPKKGDFRVQEEHGAEIVSAAPQAQLLSTADRVLNLVKPSPVYARGDWVRGADGRFLLMELELIEPSMYLRMHPPAAVRFARAFDDHVRRRNA